MPGRKQVSANLARRDQQLIKLQVIVAEATRNRRASGKIVLDKGLHHILFEAILVIHHVVRNPEHLRDTTSVVNIINRAATSLDGLRHSMGTSQTSLVPQLHSQANDIVAVCTKHGRNGG